MADGANVGQVTEDGETFLTGLESPGDGAHWSFVLEKGKRGVFRVVLDYACPRGAEGGEITVSVNGSRPKSHKIRTTQGGNVFLRNEIGMLKVSKLEGNVLKIAVKQPNASSTTIMNLRAVRLVLDQKGKG